MCSFELATMEFKNLFLNHTIQRVQPVYNMQCSVRFRFPLCWIRSEEAEGGQFPESASQSVCVDSLLATRPMAFSHLLGCRQLEGKVSSILSLLLASAWGLSLVAVVQTIVFNLCQRRSYFRHACPALGHACTQAWNISWAAEPARFCTLFILFIRCYRTTWSSPLPVGTQGQQLVWAVIT